MFFFSNKASVFILKYNLAIKQANMIIWTIEILFYKFYYYQSSIRCLSLKPIGKTLCTKQQSMYWVMDCTTFLIIFLGYSYKNLIIAV